MGVLGGAPIPPPPPLPLPATGKQREPSGELPAEGGTAAQTGAVAGAPAAIGACAGVVPPTYAWTDPMAEPENPFPGSEEHGPFEFVGKLDAAKDIMVTFQLASEGRLRAKLRPDARTRSQVRAEEIDRAVQRWAAGCGELGKLSRQERRERLCQCPQEREMFGMGDKAREMRRRRRESAGMTEESAEMCAHNEEILQGEWPSRPEHFGPEQRRRKYAVIALDSWKTEQLKGHWPRGNRDIPVVEKGACIVAAAQGRGQGLLLTVETLTPRARPLHQGGSPSDDDW
jgi:hypothetical protein